MSALPRPLTVLLRPMEEKDVPEVIEIERQAYAYPWTKGIMVDCLRVGYSAWVLEYQRLVGAYGFMSVAAGEAHLLNLCVKPRWQGMGFGRTLLARLVEDAAARAAEVVFLEVRPSNQAARRLYASAGFVEVGTRPGYYPGPDGREDALILASQLVVPRTGHRPASQDP